MKKFVALFAVALSCLAFGCKTQIVTVDVVPADAHVIANGVAYNNKSPLFIEAPTGRQLAITAYKKGYADANYVVDYQLSTLGKVEACTSIFLIPAFFLLCDTAWELKENNVTLVLQPLQKDGSPAVSAAGSSRKNVRGGAVDQTTDPNAMKIFREL